MNYEHTSSQKFGLGTWIAMFDDEWSFLIKSYQRWYVWPFYLCLNLFRGALNNIINARKYNVSLSEVVGAVGTIQIKILDFVVSIVDGQQRIFSLMLLHKAVADVAYMLSDTKLYNRIMTKICRDYSIDDENIPYLVSEKQLDQEDLMAVFNWTPSYGLFNPKTKVKDADIAKEIGGIDEESFVLKNYLLFVREIFNVINNGYEGQSFTITDIYTAVSNIQFHVSLVPKYASETTSFINTNESHEELSPYHYVVAHFASKIGEREMGSYVATMENSRKFRMESNGFLRVIAVHILHKTWNATHKNICEEVNRICKKSEQHKITCACFSNTYSSLCSLIFSLYGNAYVAMLEEDESFIPYEMLVRIRNLKKLSKSLWQLVAMGAVKLLEKEGVEKFTDLSEDSLQIINDMYDRFAIYVSIRCFNNIKSVSLSADFNRFFANHSYADFGIVETFSQFLSNGVSDKGKMPSDIRIITEQMLPKDSKSGSKISEPVCRTVLEYMDRFLNSNKNINYELYDTVEHMAPLSIKKTQHYQLEKKERQCFANTTLLTGAENTCAGDNKISYKSELVYDSHQLAIVNWKNLRNDINISKRVSANYFDDLNMENLRKRAEALAEVLLLMKEEYFGE